MPGRIALLSTVLHGREDFAAALFGDRRPGVLEQVAYADGLAFAPGLDYLLRAFTNRRALAPLLEILLRHLPGKLHHSPTGT